VIAVPPGVRILLATRPVDFRKGMDGLAALHDPNAIDAIGFTMSVAFVWPAIAKPRRRRSRPS
jgi:hypothetical protein